MIMAPVVSVRKALAAASAPAHLALHRHCWISRLAAPDLDRKTYATVLGAYRAFFGSVEQSRQAVGVFCDLSLVAQIAAMDRDLEALGQSQCQINVAGPVLQYHQPAAILGGLYVLHGAGFGAKVLNKNVKSALPDAPCGYLSLGTPVDVWRKLIAQLEARDDAEQAVLCDATNATFTHFGQWVTTYCEAH